MLLLEFKDPEMERRIVDWVMSGAYSSAADVITTALRLLDQQERAKAFGLRDIDRDVDVPPPVPSPRTEAAKPIDAEEFFREIPCLHPQYGPGQNKST